jgi:hypothetical protein
MNTIEKEISVYIAIGIVIYLIDIITAPENYCNCKNYIITHSLLLFHHIFVICAYFGWLSNNKYILYLYLGCIIFTITHWKMNDNKCMLTVIVNDECGLNQEMNLRDIQYFIGLKNSKNWSTFFLISWFGMAWGIAYIKLFHTDLFTKVSALFYSLCGD